MRYDNIDVKNPNIEVPQQRYGLFQSKLTIIENLLRGNTLSNYQRIPYPE